LLSGVMLDIHEFAFGAAHKRLLRLCEVLRAATVESSTATFLSPRSRRRQLAAGGVGGSTSPLGLKRRRASSKTSPQLGSRVFPSSGPRVLRRTPSNQSAATATTAAAFDDGDDDDNELGGGGGGGAVLGGTRSSAEYDEFFLSTLLESTEHLIPDLKQRGVMSRRYVSALRDMCISCGVCVSVCVRVCGMCVGRGPVGPRVGRVFVCVLISNNKRNSIDCCATTLTRQQQQQLLQQQHEQTRHECFCMYARIIVHEIAHTMRSCAAVTRLSLPILFCGATRPPSLRSHPICLRSRGRTRSPRSCSFVRSRSTRTRC
jgi:hypothetical protein